MIFTLYVEDYFRDLLFYNVNTECILSLFFIGWNVEGKYFRTVCPWKPSDCMIKNQRKQVSEYKDFFCKTSFIIILFITKQAVKIIA